MSVTNSFSQNVYSLDVTKLDNVLRDQEPFPKRPNSKFDRFSTKSSMKRFFLYKPSIMRTIINQCQDD